MSLFKNYLRSVVLSEAVVVNPQDVDHRVGRFVTMTSSEAGKAWLKKKVRAHIFNSPDLLVPASVEDAALYPEYAREAIERGETVYKFDHTRVPVRYFFGMVSHINDWFNAMEEVLKRTPRTAIEKEDRALTQKIMQKLMKLNFEQAHAAADEWFDHMGSRLKNGSSKTVEGADVVFEWPDGFYAVEYTSETTMREDGRDLQNCLAGAYYWKAVQKGTNKVYGIRKPNDEAVVGIRTSKLGLEEVKGKNNKPVSVGYQQHAADFLTFLKVNPAGCSDLAGASISYRDGRYGTFEEIAEVIYDQDGMKVAATDEQFIARKGKTTFLSGTFSINTIWTINVAPNAKSAIIAKALNALGRHSSRQVLDDLLEHGVVFNKTYGTVDEVGERLGEIAGLSFIRIHGAIWGIRNGSVEAKIFTSGDGASFTHWFFKRKMAQQDILEILNGLNLVPSSDDAQKVLLQDEIVYHGKKYVALDSLKPEFEDSENAFTAQIFHVGTKFVYRDMYTSPKVFMVQAKKIIFKDDVLPEDAAGVLRLMVDKYGIKDVVGKVKKASPDDFGILKVSGGLVGTPDTFFGNTDRIEAEWRRGGISPWCLDHNTRQYVIRALGGVSTQHAAKLIDMLRPKTEFMLPKLVAKHSVHDLEIEQYSITLPVAASQAFSYLAEANESQIMKLLLADLKATVTAVTKFINEHPNSKININSSYLDFSGSKIRKDGLKLLDPLLHLVREHNDAINRKVEERTREPEKFQVKDLSSRFAALNAKRNLSGR